MCRFKKCVRTPIYIFIEDGRIKASLHMGETNQNVYSGDRLDDNQWHTMKYERRGMIIKLSVDNKRTIIGTYIKLTELKLPEFIM